MKNGTWQPVGSGKLKLNLHKTTKKTRIGKNEERRSKKEEKETEEQSSEETK